MNIEDIDDCIFSVVDIETTGLSPKKDEIIEICIIKLKGVKIKEKWDTLIQPEFPVSIKLTRIHGISNDMLMLAPEKYEVLPIINKKLKDTILVEHNVSHFDSRFLEYFIGDKIWKCELNTIKLSKLLLPGLKKYSLKYLTNYLGIELLEHHSASFDAMATTELFVKLIDLLKITKDRCNLILDNVITK